MSLEYFKYETDAGLIMVRRGFREAVENVDAIIFDCDGVLIDVRESYTKAIIDTVSYFMRRLFGLNVYDSSGLMKVIHSFKKSGGFNNEWDIAYSILLHLFSELFKKIDGRIVKTLDHVKDKPLKERFKTAETALKDMVSPWKQRLQLDLNPALKLAENADCTGTASVEKQFRSNRISRRVLNAAKRFLSYPGRVGESLLSTIFEEIFCGVELFKQQYRMKPQFYFGRGLIERERRIVSVRTMEELASIVGGYNFGIATGRPRLLAEYTLGGVLDKFKRRAMVFIEDVFKEEANREEEIALTKPNPFSLLKSAEGLGSFNLAAYVGDSAEDVIMVKKACKTDKRFLSIGVYSTSFYRDDLISKFVRLETDVILPSVNELKRLIGEEGIIRG